MLRKSIIQLTAIAGLIITTGVQAADVVIYSSNNTASVEAVSEIMKKGLPNLDVAIVSGKTGGLMKRIEAEKGNALGDIFWSAGFATLGAYRKNFASYDSPSSVGMPASLIGPDNLWVGTNVHPMVLMINERQLKGLEAPKTWTDIFDPKWKGKIVMGDPTRSSSTYAQLYGIHKVFGAKGMRKLAENVINVKSTSQVYKSVAAGEFAIGITMEYAAYEYVAGGQKEIKLVYPTEGTFLSPEGAILVKGTKHEANAQKVMDMLASADLQKALFLKTFRRPAHPGVDVNALAGLPKMADIKIVEYDQLQAAADRKDVLKVWTDILKEIR